MSNPLFNSYWHKKSLHNIRLLIDARSRAQYFRVGYYTDRLTDKIIPFSIRLETKEYFPMRT